uniref:Uncharacterized protein n=1 Tax=Lactuca sativa TaxID=4236 RepID=A0A9R1VL86_LACSA|nr:hypothetical protein LSAT_V11C500258670 [Lactuca sativa]
MRLFESLKNYISKSLIKTIDHLGSVMYKLNNFLDHNVHEASRLNLRVLCIEQRLHKHPSVLRKGCVFEGKDESFGVSKSYVGIVVIRSYLYNNRKGHYRQFPPEGCIEQKNMLADKDFFPLSKKRSRSISPNRFRIKRSESASCAHRSMSPNISRRSCSSSSDELQDVMQNSAIGKEKKIVKDYEQTRKTTYLGFDLVIGSKNKFWRDECETESKRGSVLALTIDLIDCTCEAIDIAIFALLKTLKQRWLDS